MLGDLKAIEALDFLVAHLDFSRGMFSTTMSQQPALHAVQEIGEGAIPKLSDVLRQHPDWRMRMYAVYCISGIGGPAAERTLKEALPSLKPDRIAGVGGLTTRHHSMDAGEIGADYVLFGEPDAKGQRPSSQAIAERLDWWAELFEPPCVGFAASREEAAEFATAGADFVLVGDFIWADPRGAKTALIDAGQAIAEAHENAFGKPKTGTGADKAGRG